MIIMRGGAISVIESIQQLPSVWSSAVRQVSEHDDEMKTRTAVAVEMDRILLLI